MTTVQIQNVREAVFPPPWGHKMSQSVKKTHHAHVCFAVSFFSEYLSVYNRSDASKYLEWGSIGVRIGEAEILVSRRKILLQNWWLEHAGIRPWHLIGQWRHRCPSNVTQDCRAGKTPLHFYGTLAQHLQISRKFMIIERVGESGRRRACELRVKSYELKFRNGELSTS